MNSEISVRELNSKIAELEKRISILEDKIEQRLYDLDSKAESAPPTKKSKPKSIKEFFLEKGPKSGVNKTIVIGYYLEIYNEYKSFTVKDIEKGFKEAREKAPDNTSLSVYMNANKGFFAEVEEKNGNKAYELTETGIKYVDNGLKKDE